MSQATEERSRQSATAVERAEGLISRMEQSIASLPAAVSQRAQQATTRMGEQMKQTRKAGNSGSGGQEAQPKQSDQSGQSGQSNQPNQPAMERADHAVDDMGQRIGLIAAVVSLQTRKISARVREDAEDMWAEIQQVRNGRGGQSH